MQNLPHSVKLPFQVGIYSVSQNCDEALEKLNTLDGIEYLY